MFAAKEGEVKRAFFLRLVFSRFSATLKLKFGHTIFGFSCLERGLFLPEFLYKNGV